MVGWAYQAQLISFECLSIRVINIEVSLQSTLYILVCSSDKYWCVLVTYIVVCKYSVCMSGTSPCSLSS
jgi:hypothetical protein